MWEKVERTNESRFLLFTNDGRQRIRREQHEALHPDCIQPGVQTGDKGSMILEAFGWNGIGSLIITKSNRTGKEYLFHTHLENAVKSLMEDWFPDVDGIYQDYNATSHRGKTVQNCFNHKHGVSYQLESLSKSQDISVSENL
ncbi:transposase domain containing protein [Trichonephila clavipes]|nr:transposase domain containing protein [Trichonephila clavipes]